MENQPVVQHIHGLAVLSENAEGAGTQGAGAQIARIIAGSDAGLFVSQDGGSNWTDALENSGHGNSAAISALETVRSEDGTSSLFAGAFGGIYRSRDQGVTWEFISLGRPAPMVTAFSAAEEKYLHAATLEDGVYTSTDGGSSWARWNFGLIDWRVYSLAAPRQPDGSSLLLAGTETGIYASHNHGRSWREVPFPESSGAVLALASLPDGSTWLAGTEEGKIFCSKDRGESWSIVYENADMDEISAITARTDAAGEWAAVAACGGQILAAREDAEQWQDWDIPGGSASSITALSAPSGIYQGASLWAACDDGSIIRLAVP